MTISNEPGYYEEGQFGIRVETVCVTVEANTDHHFAGRKFCKFETVTMAPIKTNLIDIDLLDDGELEWLNTYHSEVRTSLQPLMSQLFPESLDFLVAETEPLLRTKKRKIVE